MAMLNFIGSAGTITPPSGLGIMVKSVQADVQNAAADAISITLSGSNGRVNTFGGLSPIVSDLQYDVDESLTISGSDGGTDDSMQVIINYVLYGDNSVGMMRRDLQHSVIPTPWRFRS